MVALFDRGRRVMHFLDIARRTGSQAMVKQIRRMARIFFASALGFGSLCSYERPSGTSLVLSV